MRRNIQHTLSFGVIIVFVVVHCACFVVGPAPALADDTQQDEPVALIKSNSDFKKALLSTQVKILLAQDLWEGEALDVSKIATLQNMKSAHLIGELTPSLSKRLAALPSLRELIVVGDTDADAVEALRACLRSRFESSNHQVRHCQVYECFA